MRKGSPARKRCQLAATKPEWKARAARNGGRTGAQHNPDGNRTGVSLAPLHPTPVYDAYWQFAAVRQDVFFRRLTGMPPPWTDDPILQRHRFTNAYRASDRVSQYLIRNVLCTDDNSPQEVFFRALLFKIFNRISTWQGLRARLGELSYRDFKFDRYDKALCDMRVEGEKVFSAAYMMPAGGGQFTDHRKHRNYLRLLEHMIRDEVPERLVQVKRMRDAFELLRSYPMIGDFLAYQYVIDLNYSGIVDFSEMEFVVPGPGARSGLRKCFASSGGLSDTDIIRVVADRQEEEFASRNITFRSLWGRRLQLIDCQNLFCEIDKYARVAFPEFDGIGRRTRIKRRYRPAPEPIKYWYPPKWGINDLVHATMHGSCESDMNERKGPSRRRSGRRARSNSEATDG